MQKGIYIFLLAGIFCVQIIKAQTITNSVIPHDYTQFTQYMDTAVTEGPAGANQVWDFSNVAKIDSLIKTNYIPPANTQNNSFFPTATLAASNNLFGGYSYFSVTDSQETFLGYWDESGNFPYSNPEVILKFPCSLNTMEIDSWAYTETYAVQQETITNNGSTTITADAWGTIKTPAGIFDSAVRVKVVRNYYDSTFSGITFVGTYSYNYTHYSWYKVGHPGYVFDISYPVIRDSTADLQFKSVSYQYGSSTLGIAAINDLLQVNVYPNPAHDFLNLTLQSSNNDKSTISLNNILGQQVYTSNLNITPGKNSLQIPVKEFAAGLYIVRCKSNCMDVSRKVMIEQ